MPDIKLALLGFGNVGRALARLLLIKRDELRRRYQINWQVVGIATLRHVQEKQYVSKERGDLDIVACKTGSGSACV